MKLIRCTFVSLVIVFLASCGRPQPGDIHSPGLKARKGMVEVDPIEKDRVVASQTIYVPAYPSVFMSDEPHRFNLAVTLSVRNTDPTHPIVVAAVRFYEFA